MASGTTGRSLPRPSEAPRARKVPRGCTPRSPPARPNRSRRHASPPSPLRTHTRSRLQDNRHRIATSRTECAAHALRRFDRTPSPTHRGRCEGRLGHTLGEPTAWRDPAETAVGPEHLQPGAGPRRPGTAPVQPLPQGRRSGPLPPRGVSERSTHPLRRIEDPAGSQHRDLARAKGPTAQRACRSETNPRRLVPERLQEPPTRRAPAEATHRPGSRRAHQRLRCIERLQDPRTAAALGTARPAMGTCRGEREPIGPLGRIAPARLWRLDPLGAPPEPLRPDRAAVGPCLGRRRDGGRRTARSTPKQPTSGTAHPWRRSAPGAVQAHQGGARRRGHGGGERLDQTHLPRNGMRRVAQPPQPSGQLVRKTPSQRLDARPAPDTVTLWTGEQDTKRRLPGARRQSPERPGHVATHLRPGGRKEERLPRRAPGRQGRPQTTAQPSGARSAQQAPHHLPVRLLGTSPHEPLRRLVAGLRRTEAQCLATLGALVARKRSPPLCPKRKWDAQRRTGREETHRTEQPRAHLARTGPA